MTRWKENVVTFAALWVLALSVILLAERAYTAIYDQGRLDEAEVFIQKMQEAAR